MRSTRKTGLAFVDDREPNRPTARQADIASAPSGTEAAFSALVAQPVSGIRA